LISVLGLSPERATELLTSDGFSVTIEETRSKKGLEGATQARVIRQRQTEDGHVALVYSVFRTEPANVNL
jgi:hypothetical protein